MALFQKSVLNKYLKTLDDKQIKAAYQAFTAFFQNPTIIENIRNDKEEQFQYGFLQQLFEKILGYTINPNPDYNLTTEFKNLKGGKKADGAILQDKKAIAVIELKGTKTKELDKITNQAFGYKNNHPTCVYVITSNFEKIRFYINDAVDYLDFDLFTLTEEQFKLLYLCLYKDHILGDLPQRIKKESTLEEENITKKLYKDYSAFKKALFNDLVTNNPDVPKLTLFKKSQKLIDRFLFIFFAEDKGLLPPNSISKILKTYEGLENLDHYKPLYEVFQQYFGYINTGRPAKRNKAEIFAFNGGLFKSDDILDNLKISDEALKNHTLSLTNYDFESEVDVNILGHIFEHSLNEIDEMTAELEGRTIEKNKTKRKKDGVFYTPKYITKYIVDNTVGKLCEEQKEAIGIKEDEYRPKRKKATKKRLLADLEIYREYLLSLTICDPACGSGAFLNQALDFLIKEHHYIDELQTRLLGGSIILSDITNDILERNIYGVDINEESVEIARLSLWLRSAKKGRALTTLSNNIKCGNSLIDDPNVAGEKAFDWAKEFPEVFKNGGFDVVIGNPPYVRVQNLKHSEIDWYKLNKEVAFKRVDISIIFFELAKHILKNLGILSFITSNQFTTAQYGQEIRRYLKEKFQIKEIVDFGDLPIFEDALTYVSIFTLINDNPENFRYAKVDTIEKARNFTQYDYFDIEVSSLSENTWILKSKHEKNLFEKLDQFKKLGDLGNAWAGLFTGLDAVLMFDESELPDLKIEKDLLLPIIRANDPKRNGNALPSKYVIYPYKTEGKKTVVLTEDELKSKFPLGYSYLLENKHLLVKRKDSRKTFENRKDWYALTRFGQMNIYKQSKIVSAGEVKYHKFSIDNSGSGFSCARVFAVTIKEGNVDLKYLMAILNSSLVKFYLQSFAPVKAGGYFSYSSSVLNKTPIASPDKESNKFIIKSIELILENTDKKEKIEQQLIRTIKRKFSLNKLSKKLQNWHTLTFPEFVKELKKKKIKLGLAEEAEWEDYFEAEKAKAQTIQAVIDKTDKEIDQMVYGLYGLTEEEIGIVENS